MYEKIALVPLSELSALASELLSLMRQSWKNVNETKLLWVFFKYNHKYDKTCHFLYSI